MDFSFWKAAIPPTNYLQNITVGGAALSPSRRGLKIFSQSNILIQQSQGGDITIHKLISFTRKAFCFHTLLSHSLKIIFRSLKITFHFHALLFRFLKVPLVLPTQYFVSMLYVPQNIFSFLQNKILFPRIMFSFSHYNISFPQKIFRFNALLSQE